MSAKPVLLAPRPVEKAAGGLHLSREWVLPPRPKPGRKPLADEPPTKRKAQNRAAQRAFRERRANRVAELEDHIMRLQREASIKEGALQAEIGELKAKNAELERRVRELSVQSSPRERSERSGSEISMNGMNNIIRATSIASSASGVSNISGASSASGASGASSPSLNSLWNLSPMPAVSLKRNVPLEIDFTERFTKRRPMPLLQGLRPAPLPISAAPVPVAAAPEPEAYDCGFCSDDTPCVCRDAREMELSIQRKERDLINEIIRSVEPDVQQMAQCSGDPGSCAKCQTDPKMTTFCRGLAANERDLPPLASLGLDKHYIPCTDAFRLLSSKTGGNVAALAKGLNRSGMMVEVESVVSCMRDLN